MSKTAYPLKLPASVKAAATRLAKADGLSPNQFIAVAVGEKAGVLETAEEFLRRRAGHAKPRDLLKFAREAGVKGRRSQTGAERERPPNALPAHRS